jgi:hypothetical protein
MALLPLAVARCDLDWSPTVSAIDACLSGFGMTDAVASAADCGAIGTLRERSRFRGPLAARGGPRSRALRLEHCAWGDDPRPA